MEEIISLNRFCSLVFVAHHNESLAEITLSSVWSFDTFTDVTGGEEEIEISFRPSRRVEALIKFPSARRKANKSISGIFSLFIYVTFTFRYSRKAARMFLQLVSIRLFRNNVSPREREREQQQYDKVINYYSRCHVLVAASVFKGTSRAASFGRKKVSFQGSMGKFGSRRRWIGSEESSIDQFDLQASCCQGEIGGVTRIFHGSFWGKSVKNAWKLIFLCFMLWIAICDFCDVTKLFVSALAIHKLFTPFKLHSHLALDWTKA